MKYLVDIITLSDKDRKNRGVSVFTNPNSYLLTIFENDLKQKYDLYIAVYFNYDETLSTIYGYATRGEVEQHMIVPALQHSSIATHHKNKLSCGLKYRDLHKMNEWIDRGCNMVFDIRTILSKNIIYKSPVRSNYPYEFRTKTTFHFLANKVLENFCIDNNVSYGIEYINEPDDFVIYINKTINDLERKSITSSKFAPYLQPRVECNIKDMNLNEEQKELVNNINLKELNDLYERIKSSTQCWLCNKYINKYRKGEQMEQSEIWHLNKCLRKVEDYNKKNNIRETNKQLTLF